MRPRKKRPLIRSRTLPWVSNELKFQRQEGKWVASADLSVPKDDKDAVENIVRMSDAKIAVTATPDPANKDGAMRIYHLSFTAADLAPPDARPRFLAVGEAMLPVTVAKAPSPAGWAVQKVGPIAVKTGRTIPVTVTAFDRPISGLKIVPNTLFEKDSEHALGGGNLTLSDPNAPGASSIDVPVFTTKILSIDSGYRNGHYTGMSP